MDNSIAPKAKTTDTTLVLGHLFESKEDPSILIFQTQEASFRMSPLFLRNTQTLFPQGSFGNVAGFQL